MHPAPYTHVFTKTCRATFVFSLLCTSLLLSACSQQDAEPASPPVQQKIELIAQDLVAVKTGNAVQRTSFSGTIRAINQSSIQAQVTATASSVNAQVGQRVQKGQVLVQLNNQDNTARLAQAQANRASAQAQANQARVMMERKQRLLNQGFISKAEYEQSRVDYQTQLENVRAQQANVDIAQKADRDGVIRSPISGVVTQRQVEPGQTVSAGQTLFEIIDPDQLEIQAKVPSDMQADLKVGSKLEYRLQGNPNLLTATISRISPIADQASRQIEFFARPHETITSLSIGAFIEGEILSARQVSGQLIPLDSIRDIQQQPYVWVIRQHKILKVNVDVLEQRYNDNLAVVRGLENSDQISRVSFTDADIHKTVSIGQN